FGKVRNTKPIIQERIALHIDANFQIVLKRVTDFHEPVRKPVPETSAVEHRHGNVDIRLELNQPLARITDHSITDTAEFHSVAILKSLRERNEVICVHLECVWMAWITHDLIDAQQLSVYGARPIAFYRFAEHDHGPSIVWLPFLHRLQ